MATTTTVSTGAGSGEAHFPNRLHELPQPRLDRSWEPTREAAGEVGEGLLWSFMIVALDRPTSEQPPELATHPAGE